MQSVLVTGGAGFIGSAVCRALAARQNTRVVSLDCLSYAGHRSSLSAIEQQANFCFYRADIRDAARVGEILYHEQVDTVIHLAAESHVDRSIDGPEAFIDTNVVGTARLLHAALAYWRERPSAAGSAFRFHHVSTDEVFGDLACDDSCFTERSPYAPSSPYAASKAGSDHLVMAWARTYGLPVSLSYCSNNYGPFQLPEKLIPQTIINALSGRALPVYGTGANVRDWLAVEDHARALIAIAERGKPGQRYAISARAEHDNLSVVETICALLDTKRPPANGGTHRDLIRFVADRPGHDRRYALDATTLRQTLGWHASESFEAGLARTVDWYLDNAWWWQPIQTELAAVNPRCPR